MTRTDNTTKAIACRVPMSDYIKFLTEASNKNMTLSEWLLVKVYSSQVNKGKQKASNSELEAKQREIENLKRQVKDLTKERDKLIADKRRESVEFAKKMETLNYLAKDVEGPRAEDLKVFLFGIGASPATPDE